MAFIKNQQANVGSQFRSVPKDVEQLFGGYDQDLLVPQEFGNLEVGLYVDSFPKLGHFGTHSR